MFENVDIAASEATPCVPCAHGRRRPWHSVATTTPSSGPAPSGTRTSSLMRRANVSFVSLGIFSWSLARAGQGRVRVRVARHDPGQGARRRHRRRPRDRDRDPAAVALGRAPGDPPGRRRRPHALAGEPADLVPDVARLPRVRRRAHPAGGDALPRAPRGGDVARLQRVRLPQPALLLRRVRAPLPHLAPAALRRPRGAQRRVGHGLLEPALHRLGPDPAAAPVDDVQQPDARARLQALQARTHSSTTCAPNAPCSTSSRRASPSRRTS